MFKGRKSFQCDVEVGVLRVSRYLTRLFDRSNALPCGEPGTSLARRISTPVSVLLVVLGLAVASPAQAQRIADVDASDCVTDPEGHAYFSLYGWVFAFDREHDITFELDIRLEHPDEFQQQIRDRDNPTTERWPEPLHVIAQMGCPGNPIMTTQVVIEPTYEQLGVPPQTRRHPVAEQELAHLTDERRRTVYRPRPVRYRLSARSPIPVTDVYRPAVEDIERFCGAGSTELISNVYICYLHGGDEAFFSNLERQYFIKIVSNSNFYRDPYNPYFSSDCRYSSVNSRFTQLKCETGYRISQDLLVSYDFFIQTYPIYQLIPLDSAIRSYLSDAFRHDLSRPTVGFIEELYLPTIDHLNLLDQ